MKEDPLTSSGSEFEHDEMGKPSMLTKMVLNAEGSGSEENDFRGKRVEMELSPEEDLIGNITTADIQNLIDHD